MLLLFFIIIRDLTFAATISLTKVIIPDYGKYIITFYGLQVIGAPFQAAHSDYFCRKKALIFAFLIVGIGHLFLYLSFSFKILIFLWLCLILNGLFGNVFPIALAGLMDINYLNNPKKTMTLAMTALGIGWLGYVYGTLFLGIVKFFWATTFCSFLCAVLCYFFFKDKRDFDGYSKKISLKKEFNELIF